MKTLEKITAKFSNIEFNKDNYGVGGGLSCGAFASRRHQDAKFDDGKLTIGKATQMFKKATGLELNFIKEIINYAVPNMEWHHAGKLPKCYGGGMKKTYFLNAHEIVDIASNWNSYAEKLELSKKEKREAKEKEQNRQQLELEFLQKNAKKVVRVEERPQFFYETDKEMNGKYGWFSSYGKYYNMKEYYTGWQFNAKQCR